MGFEISKEELLKTFGKLPATTAAPATSLDATTKVLSALDKPVISKYVDRLLGRVIKPLPEEQAGQAGGGQQPAERAAGRSAKEPAAEPQKQFSGVQIVEYLEAFLSMQDENITLGQFVPWLEENKEKLSKVVDKGLKIAGGAKVGAE